MKWISYRILIVLVHQPDILRFIGRILRRWPSLAGWSSTLASDRSVREAFNRPASFSNLGHAGNLPTGEFLIGLESGPRHSGERASLENLLPAPAHIAAASIAKTQAVVAGLQKSAVPQFELIDDYLRPIAWTTIQQILGPAAESILRDDDPQGSRCMDDLGQLGAHLIAGPAEPARVRARSLRAAASIRRRIGAHCNGIVRHWSNRPALDHEQVVRDAAGLMLVGHASVVQAGALLMQELLARSGEYSALCQRARGLGEAAWEAPFRDELRAHILVLLSRRPPFPILARKIPRDTSINVAPGHPTRLKAGRSLRLLAIAAMDDSQSDATRHGGDLVFSHGPRDCIARAQATEVLVSALTGLLTLGVLSYHDSHWRRIAYEGLRIKRMRLAKPLTRG